MLEGYTPNQVAIADLKPAVQTSDSRVTVSVGAPTPESKTLSSTPQRMRFPCTVTVKPSAVATLHDRGPFPNSPSTSS
ncbi:MAG TPA: hypothetical protein VMU34_04925 [Mycobacterium sp.]|nr:hypothetical protein [Mycobacterium sp.]